MRKSSKVKMQNQRLDLDDEFNIRNVVGVVGTVDFIYAIAGWN